jgi:hypothetical protein
MINPGFLRAAGAVFFLVCVLSGSVAAKAATPGHCSVDSYPPTKKPCPAGKAPCINPVPGATLSTDSDFQVTFSGIICFAGGEEANPGSPNLSPRQAMMIHGNFFTKRHTPKLGVYRAYKHDLQTASGRSVHCDQTYCWTSIRGLSVRIVGNDDKPPADNPVYEDKSFCELVPRLRDLLPNQAQKYELCGDSQVGLPKSPVDACFDLQGGTLIAYPFKSFQQGTFVFPDGYEIGPLQFADAVVWHGRTEGVARLQIKSRATSNQWRTVGTTDGRMPLLVAVANLGHAHHTTTHFTLNEKLYDGLHSHLPKIVVDQVSPCNPDETYCYSSPIPLIDIAGCSNTRP